MRWKEPKEMFNGPRWLFMFVTAQFVSGRTNLTFSRDTV